ncbi:MAG TPA: hypothetical protein VFZ34_02355, partial [Blastocatellia bacterium]|nr:hypothetical protein [Blastocatellia bacterium]
MTNQFSSVNQKCGDDGPIPPPPPPNEVQIVDNEFRYYVQSVGRCTNDDNHISINGSRVGFNCRDWWLNGMGKLIILKFYFAIEMTGSSIRSRIS